MTRPRRAFEIEVATLGDCKVLWLDSKNRICELSSKPLEQLDQNAINTLRQVRQEGNLSFLEALEAIKPLLRKHRSAMNEVGGYWVMSLDASAADHMVSKKLPLTYSSRFLLCSDGFARIFDLFGLMHKRTLFDDEFFRDLPRAERTLRDPETSDPTVLKQI